MRSARIISILTFAALIPSGAMAGGRKVPVRKDIKSYCLDFNRAQRGGFARPGDWKDADPAAGVAWHKTIGSNVIQSFCIAANTRWGEENPDLSYGTPCACHIPCTDGYLIYLSAVIADAVKTTGIDGFMIDWVWQPKRASTNGGKVR